MSPNSTNEAAKGYATLQATNSSAVSAPHHNLIRDRAWLSTQYQSSSNLSARATLHIRFRTNPYPWQRWVFDHIAAPHVANILELGSGPGPLWRENRDRIPLGWRIWMTDLSPGMAEEAAGGLQGVCKNEGERSLAYGAEYAVAVADAQRIPFMDGAFDVVIANHMLYHVADLDVCLAEVRRVLRKGGRFYAATNGRDHLHELHTFVQGFESSHTPERWSQDFDFAAGLAKLPAYFGAVQLYRHRNSLRVTEPGPLVAYLLSGILDDSNPVYVARFRRYVIDRLASDGPLHISNQTGLFEAVKY